MNYNSGIIIRGSYFGYGGASRCRHRSGVVAHYTTEPASRLIVHRGAKAENGLAVWHI